MNITLFNPPAIFDSEQSAPTGDTLIAEIFNLEAKYLASATWDDVLKLHVPKSAELAIELGMQETWQYAHDNPQPWVSSTALVVVLGQRSVSGICATQSMSYRATFSDFQLYSNYMVQTYRWVGTTLYFDITIQSTPFGQLLYSTRTDLAEAALRKWYDNRLLYLSTCEVIQNAEQILVDPACSAVNTPNQ